MKDQFDRHRESLEPHERQAIWQRVRPQQAKADREITIRRWWLSFGVAAAAVALVAIFIAGRSIDTARRAGRPNTIQVPVSPGVPSGPVVQGQIREIALAHSAEGSTYEAKPFRGADPFVRTSEDSLSSFSLVVGRDSYEIGKEYIENGSLPPSGSVRVEEFINAFEQGCPNFTAPNLRLFADGAPSPFGDRCQLVRVVLKARSPASPDSVEIVARNARVQVAFNRAAVASYRLIGFERSGSRTGTGAEGATIAAGYEVAALYEIKLARNGVDTKLFDARVRYEPAGVATGTSTGSGEASQGSALAEAAVVFRSSELTKMFAMAPARFRLAAAVAECAEILRGYPWAMEHKLRDVVLMAEGLATELPGDGKIADFAAIVRRAAQLRDESSG